MRKNRECKPLTAENQNEVISSRGRFKEKRKMINNKTATELATVARNGASLEVDGSRFTATELGTIARNLKDLATLKVHNSQTKTATEMATIARNGKVIFA